MNIETVFVCEKCNKRILWDTEAQCYLQHEHDPRAHELFEVYAKTAPEGTTKKK